VSTTEKTLDAWLKEDTIYDGWFSGGRDSAVVCHYAYTKLKVRPFRLVWINEGCLIPETEKYIKEYADWLGVELVTLRPEADFWELVKTHGYPDLFHRRWCYRPLKKKPMMDFLRQELREGLKPIWITGMRLSESWRRKRALKDMNPEKPYPYEYEPGLVALNWHPILHWTGNQVRRYLAENKVPVNPAWALGWSGECPCMAGMSRRQLDTLIYRYPEIAEKLAQMDIQVQAVRRRPRPSYPTPLIEVRKKQKRWVSLHEYVREKSRQRNLSKRGLQK